MRGVGGGAVYPLDLVGGVAPLWAYGTKKLTAAYAGPAIRIVRPSDSAELDIGFVGRSLDDAAVDAFLGVQMGKVSVLYDQTGAGNHATQTVNGNRGFIGPAKVAGAYAVCTDTEGSDQFYDLPAVAFNRQAFNTFSVVENYVSNKAGALIGAGSGSTHLTSAFSGSNTVSGKLRVLSGIADSAFPTISSPEIYELRSSASASSYHQRDESTSAVAMTSVTMTGGFIGKAAVTAGFALSAYNCAHIAYARVLTSPENVAMRAALGTLFDVYTATNRVVFDGDSITQALHITGFYGYPKMAARLIDAVTYNLAVTGQTMQTQITQYAGEAGLVVTRYAGNRIVLIAAGTNDLAVGRTAAQLYADAQSYAALVRADGGKVVVSTLIPRTAYGSGVAATWTDFNSLLRNGWASFADGLADFAADPVMGLQANTTDTTLYLDGLHPTRLGHGYLAPIAAAAINALL